MLADPIVAAMIAGGVALSGTALKAFMWYKDRTSKNTEQKVADAVAAAVAVPSSKAPFTIDDVIVAVTITSMAGDTQTERRIRGLRVRHGASLRSLTSDCETTGKFADSPATLLNASRDDVSFNITSQDENHFECELRIHGELGEDDDPFDYEYEFRAAGGALVDPAAIKARWGNDPLPFEFIHEIVSVPIKRLEMSVTFPPDARLQPFAFVTYGDSAQGPREELRRARAGFTFNGSAAILLLQEPQVGLRYMICWDGNHYRRRANGGG